MLPSLDEVRHRRGFFTAINTAARTASKVGDAVALDTFRTNFLPTIRDPLVREFLANYLEERIRLAAADGLTPEELRIIDAIPVGWGSDNRLEPQG